VSSGRGLLLWDFDGTLARRPGMWRGCLLEVLDAHEPGHGVSEQAIRDALRDGFPWHRPEQPHQHLNDPTEWWSEVEALMARSYQSAGIEPARSRQLAREAHLLYVDHRRGWQLYEDAVAVLRGLRAEGWRSVILSNHVPELADLVAALGLGDFVEDVITSAAIGYEKPHPQAFATARAIAGDADEVWMVGDNPVTDIAGAEAVGIPAIRVHGEPGSGRWSRDLQGVRLYLAAPASASDDLTET
jgi:putative hydrolase of the HAD superfamily